jgi:hypothetical protein
MVGTGMDTASAAYTEFMVDKYLFSCGVVTVF